MCLTIEIARSKGAEASCETARLNPNHTVFVTFLSNLKQFRLRQVVSGACLLSVFVGLTGCKFVGTDYEPVDLTIPDEWSDTLLDANPLRVGVDHWWRGFEDPALDQLIQQAVENNKDLGVAYERVVQARASRQISRSALFPSLTGNGAFSRERTSENVGVPKSAGGGDTENFYSVGGSLSWELDVLGGVRRAVESSDASLQATEESYRDFMVLLIAEVANNYLDLRTLDERILLAKQNIENQRDSLKIAEERFNAGLVPKQDTTQAQTNLSDTLAFLPQLKQERSVVVTRLAVLTGTYADDTESIIGSHHKIPMPPEGVEIGIPADLIRSRPDIRAAERSLAAQNARIGVAEADLYPRFALNGDFALLSIDSNDVFDSDSRAYSFGPSFRWNLFNAGLVRSQIQIEESLTRAAFLTYENTVLEAVGEVETSMSGIANERDRLASLKVGAGASLETVALVKDSYTKGLIDFQNVLDAERTSTRVQDDFAVSQGRLAQAYISLYVALGGGTTENLFPEAEESEETTEETEEATKPETAPTE